MRARPWQRLRRHLSIERPHHRRLQRGQVLPIFAVMAVVILGGAALLTDAAWWWVNQQRMQRAADAGALAGAIYLPGDRPTAFAKARAESAKNGFTDGAGGVVVTPRVDPTDPRRLIVDIDGPVSTNFAKVFSIDSVHASVEGIGTYVLPVPMGSPQNYYGVGFLRDAVTTTTTVTVADDTNWNPPTDYLASGDWSRPYRAYNNDDRYTTEDTNGREQVWRNFRLQQEIPNDPSVVIEGLQVGLTDVYITGGNASNCQVDVEVSWDGGTSWSTTVGSGPLNTNSNSDRTAGSSSSTSDWGAHTWVRDDLSDARFQVRLTWHDGTAACPSSRDVALDLLEVRVDYRHDQTTTTTSIEETDVVSPDGHVLAPQGFWGALQSQGAPNIQGDAYMTYYDTRTSRTNDDYSPDAYYQYEIEIPAGASNGEVWLFDPGFCEVDTDKGTGEYYTFNSPNGSSSFNPVSTFYDLYNTRMTPYDTSDDTLVYSSGNTYRRLQLRDTALDASNPVSASPCDGLAWHNDWVRIANGLATGSYRLHTYSTDPGSANDQRNTTALNAFAIWSRATGGTPRIHGLGAMEAYVRLPGGRSTEFYLAQIAAEHAGKTMVIKLWDPGDTGNLAANLQDPSADRHQLSAHDLQLQRPGQLTRGIELQQPQWYRCLVGHHEYGRQQPLQRLLGDHRDPLAIRLFGTAPVVGLGRQRGWLVEDPLQHERQHQQLLHRPDDLGGLAPGQPRAPRPGVAHPDGAPHGDSCPGAPHGDIWPRAMPQSLLAPARPPA